MNARLNTAAKTRAAWALVALIALGAPLAACGKKEAKKKPEQAPRAVRVATVEMRPLAGGLTANGVLIAREEAVVGSELSGYRVSGVYADVNSWVRRGQTLVQLDDTLLRSQIAQQQAATAQAEDQAKRVAGLDNAGVISQEQVVQRRLAAAASRAALNDLRVRQSRMAIRAPVSGRVMEKLVRPGDVASPAAPMFRIIRDGLVELEANVPEADLARVAAGSGAQVTLPNGQSAFGSVRIVSPAVDPATKLGKVRVQLPMRADLRPGGYGRVTFSGVMRPVVAVPETAVRYSAEGPTVMTLDAQNRAHQVDVRTGQRGGGWVELVQGPGPGARVLLGGAAFVLEGDKVNAVPMVPSR
ncbi:MAG: efflux RND transporter periplasmic adaptor subunit [Caulobacteraceae bacterium]